MISKFEDKMFVWMLLNMDNQQACGVTQWQNVGLLWHAPEFDSFPRQPCHCRRETRKNKGVGKDVKDADEPGGSWD